MKILLEPEGWELLLSHGSRGQAAIKMLLILLFSVVSLLFLYIYIFNQQSLVLLLRQVLKDAKNIWSHILIFFLNLYFIYMQPAKLCTPHQLFPTESWAEQSFPSRAGSGAGRALQLTQAGEESHQTVLVPGHLVLLRALAVCLLWQQEKLEMSKGRVNKLRWHKFQ